MYVCFIFKIRDVTSTRIYFPILAHAPKWKVNSRACSISDFEDKEYNLDISGASNPFDRPYVDKSFFVCFNEFYHTEAGSEMKLPYILRMRALHILRNADTSAELDMKF